MKRTTGLKAGAFCALAVLGGMVLPQGMPWMPAAAIAQTQAMKLPIDPVPLVVETSGGKKSFRIEIAATPMDRSMGLMYRTDLADDQSMLFVFEQTIPVSFWMKNTPLPLDLLFIDQHGKIRDIKQGEPYSEAMIAPREAVRFVLELKAGTAEKNGIRVGDMLRHPAIARVSGGGN